MEKAVFAFQIDGNPISCVEYGHGHINRTLKVDTDTSHSYILQRINTNIFKNPVKLMENIISVTQHLRSKSSDPYASLNFVATSEGKYYHADEENQYWRCYEFVPGFGLDTPETDEDFYQSALAFGKFQGLLADFPADTLDETIPEFHNTIDRFRQLKESIAADPKGRVKDVEKEMGDLLFAAMNVCRLLGFDGEETLHRATDKFISRFERMEKNIENAGKKLSEMTLSEMDEYWEAEKVTEFH